MKPSFPLTAQRSFRQRIGSTLALAAALAFSLQPSFVLAQSIEPDVSVQSKSKPRPSAKSAPKKKVSKRLPSDTVAEDLNRREAERAARLVQGMSAAGSVAAPAAMVAAPAPAPAAVDDNKAPASAEPPTVATIPPRAPIVSASLTPDVGTQPAATATTQMAAPLESQAPRQYAQNQPPAPSPVPIQPPAGTGRPAPAPGVTGAPGRSFGQNQLIPTQQPTLSLEVNKGTAIKLPGPAATVFVAAPDIADVQVKSPGMIYVFAKKPGDTVLYAVDDQDRVLLNTIVSVSSPVSRMKSTLDRLHPGNGVVVENQGESIVLSGVVRSALVAEDARRIALQHVNGQASKVISNIRIDAPTQVQLRVKVAEVKRDALKRVGINWQNINGLGIAPLIGTINGGFAISTIAAVGGPASGAARIQGGNFDTLLDFLATNNEAVILAEPNLVAMSGETASFLAGGEFPVIAPQSGVTAAVFSVTYKQVGVSLAFTPTIIGDRINLKVAPEVSQLSTTGSVQVPLSPTATVTIPAVQTRRASTTIELGSGQSFAVAGLLQQTSQQDIKKLPWLGDIPVLGSLFKSDAYQRSETELVIVITPYFVEPTNGQLRTPVTGRVPPTDVDRLLYQRTTHPTPPRRVTAGREPYAGPSAGFKLD